MQVHVARAGTSNYFPRILCDVIICFLPLIPWPRLQYKDGCARCVKIRRSCDRLVFIMGIPILVRHHYIETAPCFKHTSHHMYQTYISHKTCHCLCVPYSRLYDFSPPWLLNKGIIIILWIDNFYKDLRHQMDSHTSQRPVTRSFDVFFDLRLNKRLSKQSCGWWFKTPSRSLWRHRNGSEK